MNKYLKYFSGTLVGLMLSTSAFAAAEYAVVLKTLSNPFWVDMKKGIYLVNLDEKIDMDNLKKAGGNVEGFVTTDNVAVGAKGASFIIDKLGAEGGEVAIIEGKAGNASGEARRNGATEAFKKASQIKLVASQPTGTVLKHWMSPLTCCNVIRILKRSIARMTRWQWVLLRQSQTPEKRAKCWSSVQMAFRKPAKWWKPDK